MGYPIKCCGGGAGNSDWVQFNLFYLLTCLTTAEKPIAGKHWKTLKYN